MINIGDWVRIKDWHRLPLDGSGVPDNFPEAMRPMCGMIACVDGKIDTIWGVELLLVGNPVLDRLIHDRTGLPGCHWYIYDYMVEVVPDL